MCTFICKCERHNVGEQAQNVGFLLIRTRRLWEIFTFCTTIDHCTKKHPSFIEIGQRLLAKVVFTDRQTLDRQSDRQTDGRRTDNADNQTKKQSV